MLCDASKTYDTWILVDSEKYLDFGGSAGCRACTEVRTSKRRGYGKPKVAWREGIALIVRFREDVLPYVYVVRV